MLVRIKGVLSALVAGGLRRCSLDIRRGAIRYVALSLVYGFDFELNYPISDILGVSDDPPAAGVSEPELQGGATDLLRLVSEVNDFITLGHRVLHSAVRSARKALVGFVRTKIDPQGDGGGEVTAEVPVLRRAVV